MMSTTHSTGAPGVALFVFALALIAIAIVLIVRGPRGPRS